MKKLWIVCMVMAGVLVFGAGARLEATSSTHIWAPSTDVQAFGKWHLTSDFYFPVEKDNEGLLAAWERNMTEKLWVCVEYMGSESSYGSWNFGFSWKFSHNVSVLCGYNVFNNSDLSDTATLQFDLDF